jgi:tetratricopeptide (TPR) repeat protein
MRAIAIWSGVFCGALVVAVRADEQPLRWVRSLDDAKRIAAAEHKDLFVNFTGLEWCGHCIELDTAILNRKEFRAADADFVLVDLDFPSDRNQLGELKNLYEAWMKQYMIHGFPTVVLADETGRPYTYFTGYDDEVDVARFMDQLTAARKVRDARDRELAAAKQVTGTARAQRLHAAINAVATALGSLEEREDDPVLTFYQDEAGEIRRLDVDNALAIREVYDARTQARDELRRREAIIAELRKYKTKEDCPAAIAYIDQQLKEITDVKLRFTLEQRRYSRLEWMEQYAEALEGLQRLLQDPHCPADDRNWMLRNHAILLSRMGRLDEALAFYDEQIAAAAQDARKRTYFLDWKANMLFGTGRHEETIATCRDLLASARPKTDKWAEAMSYLGFALQGAGRHNEAISTYRDQLAYNRAIGGNAAYTLLVIARSQHALGLVDDERRTLDEAQEAIATQADRPAKQKELDNLREELEKARKSLVGKLPQ